MVNFIQAVMKTLFFEIRFTRFKKLLTDYDENISQQLKPTMLNQYFNFSSPMRMKLIAMGFHQVSINNPSSIITPWTNQGLLFSIYLFQLLDYSFRFIQMCFTVLWSLTLTIRSITEIKSLRLNIIIDYITICRIIQFTFFED